MKPPASNNSRQVVITRSTAQAAVTEFTVRSRERVIATAADKRVVAETAGIQIAATGCAARIKHSGMMGPQRNERVVAAARTAGEYVGPGPVPVVIDLVVARSAIEQAIAAASPNEEIIPRPAVQ